MEIKALEKGFKIYNHECYAAFLKEIMNMSGEADIFDELRKIRNGINYYGRKISVEESKFVTEKLRELIKIFK